MAFYAKMWEAMRKNTFANFHIKDNEASVKARKHYQFIVRPQNFLNMQTLANSLALLDEAYSWMESRMSGSEMNRVLSHTIFQSRKRGLDVMYSAQLASTIDLRLKRLTSTLIWAVRPDETGYNYVYFTPDGQYNRHMSLELAQKLYKVYDTHEIVEEAGSASDMDEPEIEEAGSDFNAYVKELEKLQKQMAGMNSKLIKQMDVLKNRLETADSRIKTLEQTIKVRRV